MDEEMLDARLARVVRRLVWMRVILEGPKFEGLVEALNVELDVAEMEAAARSPPKQHAPGLGTIVPFPGVTWARAGVEVYATIEASPSGASEDSATANVRASLHSSGRRSKVQLSLDVAEEPTAEEP